MSDDFIMIKRARVSFPHFFRKPMIKGKEGKRGAVFLMDPKGHAPTIRVIENKIQALIAENLEGAKLREDKLCLRDGDLENRSEYSGYKILSANTDKQPTVVSIDGKTIVTDEDKNQIYAGCYINGKVRLWAQDNEWGKRINAELISVQFAGDGEPLEAGHVTVEEAISGFEAVNDDSPEDDGFLNDAA